MSLNRVSRHALQRYQEFYPEADIHACADALRTSDAMNQHIGLRLCGRAGRRDGDKTVFLLHPERTGIFLGQNGWASTFMRFERTQHRLAVKLYGPGLPVAPSVPWAPLPEPAAPEPEPAPEPAAPLLILGVPLGEVSFANGARVRLGGTLTARRILAAADLVSADSCPLAIKGTTHNPDGLVLPTLMFEHDGEWFGIFDVSSGIWVSQPARPSPCNVVSKEARKSRHIPLAGCQARDLRVAEDLVQLLVDTAPPPMSVKRARWVLRAAAAEAKGLKKVSNGYRVRLLVGDLPITAWLAQPLALGEWWLLLERPPLSLTPEQSAVVRLLLEAGWTVTPPKGQ